MIPKYLAADKKFKVLRLSRDRVSWRSAHVLLTATERSFARPIRALEQLRPLASEGSFPRDEPVHLRVLGVDANAQGPVTHIWRDESLPFGLSVIADDNRYAALQAAVEAAEDQAKRLRGRLYRFALAYLKDGGESSPDPKDAGRLAEEIAPNLTDFWTAVGPQGERIALDTFDSADWTRALTVAAKDTYRRAIDRLPPDACRFRAEFAWTEESEQDKSKRGKKTL